MNIGALKLRVIFQRPTAAVDDYGQPLPGGYEDVAQVWAAVRPTGSSERLAAAQMQSGQTHVLQTHWRADLSAATGSWRIQYGARTFGIVGLPRNPDEAGRWLVFDCVENLNG